MEIFKTFGESIILWDNYIGVRILEPKNTDYGSYNRKICISVGQQLKSKERIEKILANLDDKTRKKIEDLAPQHTLSGFVNGKHENNIFKRLKGAFIGAYKRVGRFLGIEMASENPLELYHYVKFSDINNFIPIFAGMSIAFGSLCQINKVSKNEMENILRREFKIMLDSSKRGYEKAKETI